MAFPPLKRSSSSMGSTGSLVSPTKNMKIGQGKGNPVILESKNIAVLTKGPLKEGRRKDRRGIRGNCLVVDANGVYYILVVFGKSEYGKFNIGGVFSLKKYEKNEYVEFLLNKDTVKEQMTQINCIQSTEVLLSKDMPWSVLPTHNLGYIMQYKPMGCLFNFVAKVIEKLEVEKVLGKKDKTKEYSKQWYRVADESGNLKLSLFEDSMKFFNFLTVGKTYTFGLFQSFINGKLPEGMEIQCSWFSGVESAVGDQMLSDVNEEQQTVQQISGEVDSFRILQRHYQCPEPECRSAHVVKLDEMIMQCATCEASYRSSAVIQKVACVMSLVDEGGNKLVYDVIESCLSNLFGIDETEKIMQEDDPKLAGLRKTLGCKYVFTIHPSKDEITEVKKLN